MKRTGDAREARVLAERLGFAGDSRVDRRAFLRLAGAIGCGAALGGCKRGTASEPRKAGGVAGGSQASIPGAKVELARYPEKTELILLTDRPPQLETPLEYFKQDLTPNEAFFVRWHLSGIPVSVDTTTFRLKVRGHVDRELSLSLDELRGGFEPVSVVAVNQCSGNSRSFFEPRVPGGQWGNGAVGNARWTGVRLADLLQRASVKSGAVDVSFQGLDQPALPATPAFIKSLELKKAMEPEVIVAYQMNGADLPMLNGFPLRLIVPGWYGTYWVKSLTDINVLAGRFHGFWMDKAYRVPRTPHAIESPDHQATDTIPINRMTVRSLFVSPAADVRLKAGAAQEIEGIAFDGGSGIAQVEVSTDGGSNWSAASLDPDLGKYAWRRWRLRWTPAQAGQYKLLARATNAAGETQTTQQWNRSGYARDVIEQLNVTVG